MNRRSRHLLVLTDCGRHCDRCERCYLPGTVTTACTGAGAGEPARRGGQAPDGNRHAAHRGGPEGRSWPAESPLPNAVSDIKDAVNRGLLTTVLENEPLTTNKNRYGRGGTLAGDSGGDAGDCCKGQRRHRCRRLRRAEVSRSTWSSRFAVPTTA